MDENDTNEYFHNVKIKKLKIKLEQEVLLIFRLNTFFPSRFSQRQVERIMKMDSVKNAFLVLSIIRRLKKPLKIVGLLLENYNYIHK